MTPRFSLGRIVATPGFLGVVAASGQDIEYFLARHAVGDWGDVDDHDARANEAALTDGRRLLSVYRTLKGVVVWVVTEANRSVTTLLLPEEY